MHRAASWFVLLLCLQAWTCRAGDRFELYGELDLRLIDTDASPSFLEGGLGRQRFDPDSDGLQLGRAFASARLRVADTVTANLVAGSYGDGDANWIDATEAYVDYRPYPDGPWRWRLRGGMFYAPVSLENRGPGWNNVYTVSSSALATWIGEEFRTVGLEGEARWRGQAVGSPHEVAFVLGAFGWNDPAGVLLAFRGFALHDRQTPVPGQLPFPGSYYEGGSEEIEFFKEIDDRPGYYAGVSWRYAQTIELRALHYDNCGDPTAFDGSFAWDTHFNVAGLRFEPGEHWTLIAQWLGGETIVGGAGSFLPTQLWDLQTGFALASFAWGPSRISVRYDRFRTRQRQGFEIPNYDDTGHAASVAWLRDLGEHWQLAAEWLRIRSTFDEREELGLPATIDETQTQLVLRYFFKFRR